MVASVVFPMVSVANAQVATGSISGRITDPSGGAIRGAAVAVQSPNLQGVQRAASGAEGGYLLRLLPPGPYTITVEAPDFAPTTLSVTVGAAQPVVLNVTLGIPAVTESLMVVTEAETFASTPQASTNLRGSVLSDLPTARTLLSAVDLSPSVHASGPGNARVISGAMSFENVYLLDGVQVQDNLRGTPLNLFIEDAIQETTTTTSGIPAEYGRFTGGLVTAITKSGGNTFTGSYRTTLTNDDWRTTSPFGERKVDSLVPTHEFTIGGPIVRNRTWFFAAGRLFDQTLARETVESRLPYDFEASETRLEGKITQAVGDAHSLKAAYLHLGREEINNAYPGEHAVMDLRTLTARELPERLVSVHYGGAVSASLAVEAQFSHRSLAFRHDGGTSTDLIQGTPLIDFRTGNFWWAPAFCGVCADLTRENDSVFVKGSFFRSGGTGSHHLTFGYDTFNDKRDGDNEQSASGYHVYASRSFVAGGEVYPVLEPGFSAFVVHWPLAESSRGARFRTHGLFVNDQWAVTPRVSLNLGLRWDRNRGRDSSRNLVADDSAFSPRLGLVWDPTGRSRTTVHASFSRYVAAISGNIANQSSPAGTPSILVYPYFGAPINGDADAPLVGSAEALGQVFDWFMAADDKFLVQATVPGAGLRIPASLRSPHADEVAAGFTQRVGQNATLRIDVVDRRFGDFYADRIDTTTGRATDDFGNVFDVQFIENTNLVTRRYTALNAQGSYRAGDSTVLGASYTLSTLRGNINGENVGSGPVATSVLVYPEYRELDWAFPTGNLRADQRHRARLWAVYDVTSPAVRNRVSLGIVQQMETGAPYGAAGQIVMADLDGQPLFFENPGYAVPPATSSYFFTPRDEFRTQTMFRTDLSVTFTRGLGALERPEIFAQLQVQNAFNQFQLFNLATDAIDTTVVTAVDDPSRFAVFDPFTETPVRGTHWEYGPDFGTARGASAYTRPRTLVVTFGLRH
jgi:hypothetical protein